MGPNAYKKLQSHFWRKTGVNQCYSYRIVCLTGNIADTSIIIAWSLSMLFGLPSFFLFEESIVQGNETDFQIVSKGDG